MKNSNPSLPRGGRVRKRSVEPPKRIFGVETEYGCLIHDGEADAFGSPADAAAQIRDYIFNTQSLGLLDLHHRAYDEPPGNGGFLKNGGRLYVDMGHIEYASPECATLADIVTFDKSGDRILQGAVEAMGIGHRVSFIKNNIDHETGATFGSHENYLVSRDFPFTVEGLSILTTFLVTRQIFTGAGRVGATLFPDGWVPLGPVAAPEVRFQLSQRADHVVNNYYQWVQFNRAIINTRDEPLADPTRYRRIHLLLGDSNLCEVATALKFGTTALALELIAEGAAPGGYALADPVHSLKSISRDPERAWPVELADGKSASALEIQRAFLSAARKTFAGRDSDTDWTIEAWSSVLDDLAADWRRLVGRVDWASKLWLLETFIERERVSWDDPWVKSLDLEYHNLDPERGLYYGLEAGGWAARRTTDSATSLGVHRPPRDTRAHGRGEVVRRLIETPQPYIISWPALQIKGREPFAMFNPFKSYAKEAADYLDNGGGIHHGASAER